MADSPLSPHNLSLTPGLGTIGVYWTNRDAYASPLVVMRSQSGGFAQNVGEVNYPANHYHDNTVEDCESYTYYVTTSGEDEFGLPYGPTNSAVGTPLLPAPTGFNVAKVDNLDAVDLDWTLNSTAPRYVRIYRRSGNTGSWLYSDTGATSGVRVGGLEEGYLYGFKVGAYNPTGGAGATCLPGTATVDVIPPSGLLAVGNTGDNTVMDLSWDDNSGHESGYEINMDGTASGTAGSGDTGYSQTGLTPAQRYVFKVRAMRGATASDWSATASAVAGFPPGIPTATLSVLGPYDVKLVWVPTGPSWSGFNIYRSTGGVGYDFVTGPTAGATSFQDVGLDSDTLYFYLVSAWNASGEVDSLPATGTTENDTEAPTGLALTVLSDTRIRLKFSNNSDDVDYHRVMYRATGDSYGTADQTSFNPPATGGVQGNLAPDTQYFFKVRDVWGATASAYCAEVGATTSSSGTPSTRRNETYFAFGNELCLTTDTPQGVRGMDRVWTSKPTDFSEQDPESFNRFKTVEKVSLEFEDLSDDTPTMVSLSIDGGVNWIDSVAQATADVSSSRYVSASVPDPGTGPASTAYFFNLGNGDGAPKSADFHFVPVSSKYFQFRVRSYSSDTHFAWTGMYVYYKLRGYFFESN
jgi:fibronectin type 3 domain-containing protein